MFVCPSHIRRAEIRRQTYSRVSLGTAERSALGIRIEAQRRPIDILPLDEIRLCDVVLQRADGTVGVFSFQGRFEMRLLPTYNGTVKYKQMSK
jgi:hypothetical protein